MKIVGIQLVSLVSSFQYESNDTNYVQYNQNFVAQLFQSKLILKCVCALFIETEVVCAKKIKMIILCKQKKLTGTSQNTCNWHSAFELSSLQARHGQHGPSCWACEE
jgi:hypothetical protein